MVCFVGEPENEGFVLKDIPGLSTKVRSVLRIRMRTICLGVYGHGVRVAKQLLEGFVDIYHQQCDIAVVFSSGREIEAYERADAVRGFLCA
ncbi:hypothetical protein PS723_06545 [Pseudomonas fluorescens]|uniref:Uncharacterized protein n=1 Tax=Pseudomonas fluorescens TaxID=294 RepID=A0A5E7G428_PSEFL|nr:hypothetical protein PS723_06545 [Pseudomonas fluorescens]